MSLLCVEFDFRCKSLNGILKEDLQSRGKLIRAERTEQRGALYLGCHQPQISCAFECVDEAEGRNWHHCEDVCPLRILLKQKSWMNICVMTQKGQ